MKLKTICNFLSASKVILLLRFCFVTVSVRIANCETGKFVVQLAYCKTAHKSILAICLALRLNVGVKVVGSAFYGGCLLMFVPYRQNFSSRQKSVCQQCTFSWGTPNSKDRYLSGYISLKTTSLVSFTIIMKAS